MEITVRVVSVLKKKPQRLFGAHPISGGFFLPVFVTNSYIFFFNFGTHTRAYKYNHARLFFGYPRIYSVARF